MKWTNQANLLASEINETLVYDVTLGRTNLYTNGDFEFGNDFNFWSGLEIQSDSPQSGNYYAVQPGVYAGWQSGEMVPVDTTKEYELSVWVKTITRSAEGSLAGGHIGFACYDKDRKFIDLRNCGGINNTYLTRPANPGDVQIYVQNQFNYIGDVTGLSFGVRPVLFFPPDHPEYSEPHFYTRLGFGDYNVYYDAMDQVSENEWMITLRSPLPNFGYELPAGTPISRGHHGGTYNYAFGNPYYPETWTNYRKTIPANIELRNSDYRFRPKTKYIRFLILGNYNIRNQAAPLATFGLDNIALACTSEFQGNDSNEVAKAKKATNGTMYAQEFNELNTGAVNGKLGGLSRSGEMTVNGQIIEE